jgi:hypothetical protein
MLPGRLAVGVIDHKPPNIILFSCITAALLLPCDSDQQLSPWVSLHLTHTLTHNRFPGFANKYLRRSAILPIFTITTLRCCLTDSDTAN